MIDTIIALWIAFSSVGFIFSLWAINDAVGDREWLRDSGRNGERMIVAAGSVRNEWFRLGVMLFFLAAGVSAVTRDSLYIIDANVYYIMVYGSLLAGLIMLVMWTILERLDRHKLIHRAIKRKNDEFNLS